MAAIGGLGSKRASCRTKHSSSLCSCPQASALTHYVFTNFLGILAFDTYHRATSKYLGVIPLGQTAIYDQDVGDLKTKIDLMLVVRL